MKALTNWSVNSRAKVLHLIRSQEYIHWFYGLREAEMHVLRVEMEMEQQEQELDKLQQSYRSHQLYLNSWQIAVMRMIAPRRATRMIATTQAEMAMIEKGIERIRVSQRDSQMQLNIAQTEYQRISNLYGSSQSLAYADLQDLSIEALDRQHAMMIAGRTLAARRQLPPDVGELLITMPPEKRDRVISEALFILNGIEIATVQKESMQVLAHHPPEIRQAALIQAAHLLSQSNEVSCVQH